MGYRLKGPLIEHARGHDIVSDGIPLGGIQVPGEGQPIVLLVDRQTAGGYTKIATVISVDIGRLGQARPGHRVRFREVTLGEAHAALEAERRWLDAAIEA
jgi:allophanate hydrolase subunit 2